MVSGGIPKSEVSLLVTLRGELTFTACNSNLIWELDDEALAKFLVSLSLTIWSVSLSSAAKAPHAAKNRRPLILQSLSALLPDAGLVLIATSLPELTAHLEAQGFKTDV